MDNDASTVDRPFAPPLETIVHLPVPPSVNRIWRARGKGFYASPEYVAWIHQCDASVLMQGGTKRLTKMPGRYEVLITLDEVDCQLDLDNAAKALIDYARRRLELMVDDSKRYMRRVTIEWGTAPSGCSIRLRSLP